MSKKKKAASVSSIIGSGGLGFGTTAAAQSNKDDDLSKEISLSEPTAVVDEVSQPLQATSETGTQSSTTSTTTNTPKYTKAKLFGESTKDVAGARYGGQISDYRPTFSPETIDFSKATQANIYVDLEYDLSDSSLQHWFDAKVEFSLEYGGNKGLYVYSHIGNREKWWQPGKYGLLGTIKEKHKIVYLNKNGTDWRIDSGFLYENHHELTPGKPIIILKQDSDTNKNKLEIKKLCTSYWGCGELKSTTSTKWSAHYKMKDHRSGSYFPRNPFIIYNQHLHELSALWRYWYWNPHQYNFNGVYDKNASENDRWKIPRRGMYMGWSRLQLIIGSGNWTKECEETGGESCGLNTYPMLTAVSP